MKNYTDRRNHMMGRQMRHREHQRKLQEAQEAQLMNQSTQPTQPVQATQPAQPTQMNIQLSNTHPHAPQHQHQHQHQHHQPQTNIEARIQKVQIDETQNQIHMLSPHVQVPEPTVHQPLVQLQPQAQPLLQHQPQVQPQVQAQPQAQSQQLHLQTHPQQLQPQPQAQPQPQPQAPQPQTQLSAEPMIDENSVPFDQTYIINTQQSINKIEYIKENLGNSSYMIVNSLMLTDAKLKDQWERYLNAPLTELEQNVEKKFLTSIGDLRDLHTFKVILEDALKNDYDSILVLYDTILFHKDFITELHRVYADLPEWKLLYLGIAQHTSVASNETLEADGVEPRQFYEPNSGSDLGFAVAIDKSVYILMLEQLIKMHMPVFLGTMRLVDKLYSLSYVLRPNLIIQDLNVDNPYHPEDVTTLHNKFGWDMANYLKHVSITELEKEIVSEMLKRT